MNIQNVMNLRRATGDNDSAPFTLGGSTKQLLFVSGSAWATSVGGPISVNVVVTDSGNQTVFSQSINFWANITQTHLALPTLFAPMTLPGNASYTVTITNGPNTTIDGNDFFTVVVVELDQSSGGF